MSTPTPTSSSLAVLVLGLLLAAATGWVFATYSLPFTDLAQHAATLAMLRAPEAYGPAYRLQLSAWGTNSLWFVLDGWLWSSVLTPRGSVALGSWLAVVLLPLGLAAWSRALRGDAAAAALLGWAAAWSMPLFRGYLHYALALPVGLLALALAQPPLPLPLSLRSGRAWARALALVVLLGVLFLLHVQALAFVLGALAIQALVGAALRPPAQRRALLAAPLICALPALALLGGWLAQNLLRPTPGAPRLGSLQGGLGAVFDPVGWALRHLAEASQGVLSDAVWDDALAWGLLAAGLLGGLGALRSAETGAAREGPLAGLAIALSALLLYLFLPLHIEGQFFLSTRMASWVLLALLPLATLPLPLPAPWPACRLALCALLAVGASAGALRGIVRFAEEAAPLDALLAQIPPGQRVMLWAPSRNSDVVASKPYTHHAAWYVADGTPGSSTSFSFAAFRPNPVVYRDADATPHTLPGEEFRAWCTAFAGRAADVDHVIAREDRRPQAMCDALSIYAPQLRHMARQGEWSLYRVTAPLPAQTVDCACPPRP